MVSHKLPLEVQWQVTSKHTTVIILLDLVVVTAKRFIILIRRQFFSYYGGHDVILSPRPEASVKGCEP